MSSGVPRRRRLLGAALVAGGAYAGYRMTRAGGGPPDLARPLPGESREIAGRSGPLALYVEGEGAPLLLVHSVNAAASAYEVRPIFERMRTGRRVYAPDLPGFGHSDRSPRRYEIRTYVDAIHDVLDAIGRETTAPVDAVALSLSSEFLTRAALERPDAFRTLTFVTPTGFDLASVRRHAPPGATREVPALSAVLDRLPFADGLFSLLTSRRSIRFFLRKTFGSNNIDAGLLDYDYRTAHQPGAKNAPLAFISGRLFGADAAALYQRLTHPVLMTQATRGDFSDFGGADWIRDRPHWRTVVFETGALPHFEDAERFCTVLERFLDDPPVPSRQARP